jgi:hypothetical protein
MLEILLNVMIVVVLFGLAMWVVKRLIPMDEVYVNALNVLSVVFLVLYVGSAILQVLGAWHGFPYLVHWR